MTVEFGVVQTHYFDKYFEHKSTSRTIFTKKITLIENFIFLLRWWLFFYLILNRILMLNSVKY